MADMSDAIAGYTPPQMDVNNVVSGIANQTKTKDLNWEWYKKQKAAQIVNQALSADGTSIDYNKLGALAKQAGIGQEYFQDIAPKLTATPSATQKDVVQNKMQTRLYGGNPNLTTQQGGDQGTGSSNLSPSQAGTAKAPDQDVQGAWSKVDTQTGKTVTAGNGNTTQSGSGAVVVKPSDTPATDWANKAQDDDWAAFNAATQKQRAEMGTWDPDDAWMQSPTDPNANRDMTAEQGVQQPTTQQPGQMDLGQGTLHGNAMPAPAEGEGLQPDQAPMPQAQAALDQNAPTAQAQAAPAAQDSWTAPAASGNMWANIRDEQIGAPQMGAAGGAGAGAGGAYKAPTLQPPDVTKMSPDQQKLLAATLIKNTKLGAKWTVPELQQAINADFKARQAALGPAPQLGNKTTTTVDSTGKVSFSSSQDQQKWLDDSREWLSKQYGLLPEIQKDYGAAIADQYKLQLDNQKAQIEQTKFENDVTKQNATYQGLQSHVRGMDKLGKSAGLSGQLNPKTFTDNTDATNFENKLTAYNAISQQDSKDAGTLAGQATLIKNIKQMDGLSSTEAMDRFLTVAVSPNMKSKANALLAQGLSLPEVLMAVGSSTVLGDPQSFAQIKSSLLGNSTFKRQWAAHSGGGREPTLSSSSGTIPSAGATSPSDKAGAQPATVTGSAGASDTGAHPVSQRFGGQPVTIGGQTIGIDYNDVDGQGRVQSGYVLDANGNADGTKVKLQEGTRYNPSTGALEPNGVLSVVPPEAPAPAQDRWPAPAAKPAPAPRPAPAPNRSQRRAAQQPVGTASNPIQYTRGMRTLKTQYYNVPGLGVVRGKN